MGSSGKSTKQAIYDSDVRNYNKYGMPANWPWSGYSVIRPHEIIKIRNCFDPLITICMVTYKRYEDTRRSIEMWLRQTDPHFCLEVWQDGPDPEKRVVVESFKDDRVKYFETPERTNRHGHDNRHRSMIACQTKYWCTTNDDNWPTPLFVETVLNNIGAAEVYRYAVAMINLPTRAWDGAKPVWDMISDGVTDYGYYVKYMKTLDTALDICGDVDACGFVVSKRLANEVGWKHMEFEGDWLTWQDVLATQPVIKRENIVLQAHR
jgi:hypothetical protein